MFSFICAVNVCSLRNRTDRTHKQQFISTYTDIEHISHTGEPEYPGTAQSLGLSGSAFAEVLQWLSHTGETDSPA